MIADFKNLRKLKTGILMEPFSKISCFSTKMAQKALRNPLEPLGIIKINFFSCQDMKTLW